MVRPAQRRELVCWAETAFALSERRACRAVGAARSSQRYLSTKAPQAPLRSRIRELAASRVRAGYRQIHVLLRREGWGVNHKRTYRLYSEEGLTLKPRRPRRHRSASTRLAREAPTAPNEQWAMDFMHDTLSDGRSIRVLTAIDLYSRECLALVASKKFSGGSVAEFLTTVASQRGKFPQKIRVDNGTEFTSRSLDHWAYWNRVTLDFSRPGKPSDNAFIESFNASVRRECLSQHWFIDLRDAQRTLNEWKQDYNNVRPHSALNNTPPALYRTGGDFISDSSPHRNWRP